MSNALPHHPQRVIPYLGYRDAPKAIEFLCRAFGFEEKFRMPMPDGRIGHAELVRDGNTVMLASEYEELGLFSPLSLPGINALFLVYVSDVDAHYAHAHQEGATLLGEPADQEYGDRSYRATDPEGHRWIFAAPIQTSTSTDETREEVER